MLEVITYISSAKSSIIASTTRGGGAMFDIVRKVLYMESCKNVGQILVCPRRVKMGMGRRNHDHQKGGYEYETTSHERREKKRVHSDYKKTPVQHLIVCRTCVRITIVMFVHMT